MEKTQLKIMVVGAHPDDCEMKAAGVAQLYRQAEHQVKFISMTDGSAGHHSMQRPELAKRRKSEADKVSALTGIEYEILDNLDGELEPTLAIRKKLMKIICSYAPDLIITHRPNDYHPDHRYTSILVQDSAFTVTVPNYLHDAPFMKHNPVVAYLSDKFQKPSPFSPTVVVDIDSVIEKKLDMLDCHESQVYEWLPFNLGHADEVPADKSKQRKWLAQRYDEKFQQDAVRFRDSLIKRYGKERGEKIRYAEAFEPCEYGSPLTEENIPRLFPFFDH